MLYGFAYVTGFLADYILVMCDGEEQHSVIPGKDAKLSSGSAAFSKGAKVVC